MVTKKLKIVSMIALISFSGSMLSSAVGQVGQLADMLPQLAQIFDKPLSDQAKFGCAGLSILGMFGQKSDSLADAYSALKATSNGIKLIDIGMTLDQPSHMMSDVFNSYPIGSTAATLAALCASRYGYSFANACPKLVEPVVASCPPFALKMALGASLLYSGRKLAQCSFCQPYYAKMKAGCAQVKNLVNSNSILKYGTYGSVALYYILVGMQARQRAVATLSQGSEGLVDPITRMADVCLW